MNNQNKRTTQMKIEKKRINVVTGAQRRKTSYNKGPSVSNMKTTKQNNPRGLFIGNTFRVKKREFITDVVPSSKFTPKKIEINPALPESFPWLSGLAPSFQKYKILKFKVCYEPSQSTVVPGMFMFAPEFNVTDGLPISKIELLEYSYATRGPIWKSFSKDISTKDIMQYKEYYVRNTDTTSLVLYDPFFLVYATDNVSTDLNVLGEIWFEYEIEFSIPQTVNKQLSEDLFFKSYSIGGDFTNSKFLGSTQTSKGSLKVTLDQSIQLFTFSQQFIGQMIITTKGNDGDSNSMTNNPGTLVVSGENLPILLAACGGSGYGQDGNDIWRTYSYSLYMDKGDTLAFGDYFTYNRTTDLYIQFYLSNVYEQPF